jgi:hypothetical protein
MLRPEKPPSEVEQLALVPISPALHGKTKIRPMTNFSFTSTTTAVPVYGSEIVAMGYEVPVVFMRDAAGFAPAALLGLKAGQNLFLDPQGRWAGTHIPAIWRRGPFRLAQVEGEPGGKMVLCLDDGSDQVNEAEGLPLFDETGAPSALLGSATTLLSQLQRDIQITRNVCAALDRLGLIVPWNLDITQADGTSARVNDLFQVDETRIGTLSAEELLEVRNAGALPLIYAHLLSLAKVKLLARLAQAAEERARQQAAVQKGNLNLDRAFGIVEDDPFLF